MYKIALATSDGILVDKHFGCAEKFQIFELYTETNEYKFIETRNVKRPLCQDHSHEESFFKEIITLLSDIHAIFVAQIGIGAYLELQKYKISVYEFPHSIKSAIENVLKNKLWEEDKWQIPTNI